MDEDGTWKIVTLLIRFIAPSDSNTTTPVAPMVVGVDVNEGKSIKEKRHIPSASTALVIGGILGLLQTLFLIFGAKILLRLMGVKSVCISIE